MNNDLRDTMERFLKGMFQKASGDRIDEVLFKQVKGNNTVVFRTLVDKDELDLRETYNEYSLTSDELLEFILTDQKVVDFIHGYYAESLAELHGYYDPDFEFDDELEDAFFKGLV
jgi:hypothetical protein